MWRLSNTQLFFTEQFWQSSFQILHCASLKICIFLNVELIHNKKLSSMLLHLCALCFAVSFPALLVILVFLIDWWIAAGASARGFIYSGSGSGSTDLILFTLFCLSHLHLIYYWLILLFNVAVFELLYIFPFIFTNFLHVYAFVLVYSNRYLLRADVQLAVVQEAKVNIVPEQVLLVVIFVPRTVHLVLTQKFVNVI